MSKALDLVQAVVAEINNGIWSLVPTVQSYFRPRFSKSELASLRVSVVPRSLTIDPSHRTSSLIQYQIDIAVQRKLETESVDEIDSLIIFVEELVRHFQSLRPASMLSAVCAKVENEPIYAIEHLDELRCFTSIITLTFYV